MCREGTAMADERQAKMGKRWKGPGNGSLVFRPGKDNADGCSSEGSQKQQSIGFSETGTKEHIPKGQRYRLLILESVNQAQY